VKDRGLDLSRPEAWSAEEETTFREFYTSQLGFVPHALDFWMTFHPETLKRYRLQVAMSQPSAVTALGMLHLYAVQTYEDGVLYETRYARALGATKEQILETLAAAFIHGGPRSMRVVASAVTEELATFTPNGKVLQFAPGWEPDPVALRSGIDLSDPELSPADRAALEGWYEQTIGEVPAWVSFLAEHRPGVLKAYRGRLENAIRDSLPKQVLPWLMIQLNTARGFQEGIREWSLVAKAFGVTEHDIVEAVVWGSGFGGGSDGISIASAALRDVLTPRD
jgi:alkylhydroperoxidase/carboxymuconolactone decarboxylase family protein YurZ